MLGTTSFNFFRWIEIAPEERPERTLPESEKDTEDYHLKCARHYAGRHQGWYSDWFRMMAAINTGFANEQLWGMPEDKEMFLMNKGVTTTRRALKSPLIRPMVTRLVGQLSRVSVQAEAKAATQAATTRRENAMKQAVLFARAAQQGGPMAEAMGSMGVEPDEEKMSRMAEQTFQDMFVIATNSILTMCSQKNNLEAMRKTIGEQLAVSGMAAMHAYTHGSELRWEPLMHEEVIFDTSCNKPDFTDMEYCGLMKIVNVPDLAERYQPKKEVIKQLDSLSRAPNADANRQWTRDAGPRVATIYWKDIRWVEKGFVEGLSGPELVDIDEIDPDTKKPRYTEADLIDPPQNQYTAHWTGKTDRRCVQYIRYCTFIPREYTPNMSGSTAGDPTASKSEDVVLSYGVYQLQETHSDDVYTVNFPIKFSTWSYISGYVVAPVSAAVSPQRVMNQVLSDVVWRMSKAKGTSRAFDPHAITAVPGQTIKQFLHDAAEGDDVILKATHLGGIPQAMGEIQGGYDKGLFEGLGILENLRDIAENSTGIFKENYGAPDGPNQLVGVKQLQLQQASVMQQPFYDAVQRLYEQVHQFNAQAGRQWYIRHPWVLEDMVGTEGRDVLDVAGDYQYEQFRVEVKLALNSDEIKQATDQLALQFYQLQLADGVTATQGLGKEYPEQLYSRVAQYNKEAKEAAIAQAEADAAAAQEAALMQEEAALAQQETDLYGQMVDASLKADQINQKAQAPITHALVESLKPQDPAGMTV